MRVLLISHSSALYGAQRSLLDLGLGLRAVGVEAVISIPEDGPLGDLARQNGFDVRILPCRNWVNSRGAYHWVRKFLIAKSQARKAAEWVDKENFDLIHTNSIVTPVGAMVAKRVGKPHLWHVREGMPPKANFFFMPFPKVQRFLEDTTRFMIGISRHTCEGMAVFCPPDRIRQIYNGPISETDAMAPMPPRPDSLGSSVRLLCVGRSGVAKGTDVAAKAVTLLRAKGLDVSLTIAGAVDADFRAELLRIAPEGLNMPGFVSDTTDLYRTHDILVMASVKEAFGRVTVEAMAHGCMVVGTNSGGTPELIAHEKTGMLWEPGNAEALVAQIERLRSDPNLVALIRRQAHEDAFARFTRERYAREVAQLYHEAVNGG